MQTRKEDSAFAHFDDEFGVLPGLSKREYFAAIALQGILANPEFMSAMACQLAVKKADELIFELNKTDT
ncbi:hypothetical protein [Anabaena sp. PCC 7108]|uniref:hypothetical protein n=1 Tax=Anabaena sp. PCC 7108 TaxID=163908 RepID=UPI0003486F37|nr:hypothetical protein [Anabaena sp. PCC 7108]